MDIKTQIENSLTAQIIGVHFTDNPTIMRARYNSETSKAYLTTKKEQAELKEHEVNSDNIATEIDRITLNEINRIIRTPCDNFVNNYKIPANQTYVGEMEVNLYSAISRQANIIAMRTRRGGGDMYFWAIIPPKLLETLRRISIFKEESSNCPAYCGQFKYGLKVFCVDNQETIIVGYKGRHNIDAGMHFCCNDYPIYNINDNSVIIKYDHCLLYNEPDSLGNSADYFEAIEVIEWKEEGI